MVDTVDAWDRGRCSWSLLRAPLGTRGVETLVLEAEADTGTGTISRNIEVSQLASTIRRITQGAGFASRGAAALNQFVAIGFDTRHVEALVAGCSERGACARKNCPPLARANDVNRPLLGLHAPMLVQGSPISSVLRIAFSINGLLLKSV